MSRNNHEVINVVDLESTCWETPIEGVPSEIIEIGICSLYVDTIQRHGKNSYLVKPTFSEVSEFCTNLTTITPEMVKDEKTLPEVLPTLIAGYALRKHAWASWGDYDRVQFERNCALYDTKYPFGRTHFNVKAMFSLFAGLKHEVGMAEALRMMNLELEGTHHRGVDDAWNIANILALMLSRGREGFRGLLEG